MNLEQAKICVELSDLTYENDSYKGFNSLGFAHVRFFENEGSQAYVVHNETDVYVVYRGTDFDWQDILTLTNSWPSRLVAQGKVQAGYAEAVDKVWFLINNYLQEEVDKYGMENNIYFTGHSLGGAMAIVSAARSDYIAKVYTFGSPRVGNKAFATSVLSTIYRVTNENDIIPIIFPLFGYHHGGVEYKLFNGKVIEVKKAFSLWLKISWYKLKKFQWFDSLIGDHKSVEYVRVIKNL